MLYLYGTVAQRSLKIDVVSILAQLAIAGLLAMAMAS